MSFQKSFKRTLLLTLHKKWCFPLSISPVNVTKPAGNCGLVSFSLEILNGKLFFVYCKLILLCTFSALCWNTRFLLTRHLHFVRELLDKSRSIWSYRQSGGISVSLGVSLNLPCWQTFLSKVINLLPVKILFNDFSDIMLMTRSNYLSTW